MHFTCRGWIKKAVFDSFNSYTYIRMLCIFRLLSSNKHNVILCFKTKLFPQLYCYTFKKQFYEVHACNKL